MGLEDATAQDDIHGILDMVSHGLEDGPPSFQDSKDALRGFCSNAREPCGCSGK